MDAWQGLATSVGTDAATFTEAEADAWVEREQWLADAASAHADAVAQATADLFAAMDAAEGGRVMALTSAGLAWSTETAAAEQERVHKSADAAQTWTNVVAGAEKAARVILAEGTHSYETKHWTDTLEYFTSNTNMARDDAKSEASDLIAGIQEDLDADYQMFVTDAANTPAAIEKLVNDDVEKAIADAKIHHDDAIKTVTVIRAAFDRWELTSFSQPIPSDPTIFDDVTSYMWNQGLDNASNFFAGWADTLTAGLTSRYRSAIGASQFVDTSSGAYMGGQILGTVHGVALGFAAGGAGACQAGSWAVRVANTLDRVNNAADLADVAERALSGELSAWDALTIAPAGAEVLGKVARKAGFLDSLDNLFPNCFVGDTSVVVREAKEETPVVASTATATASQFCFGIAAIAAGTFIALGQKKRDEDEDEDEEEEEEHRLQTLDAAFIEDDEQPAVPIAESELDDPMTTAASIDNRSQGTSVALATREESAPRPASQRGGRRKFSVVFKVPAILAVTACWLLGLTLLWHSPAGFSSSAHASLGTTGQPTKFETRAIADMRVGHRVLAHNPELGPGERPALHIEPAEWRQIALRVNKPDGTTLDVSYLRPAQWLSENNAQVGRQIYLVLPELKIDGPASVLSISACPAIESGPGRLVTATFCHSSGDLYDLSVEGLKEPIGTTGNHPFWSQDRQAFVQAQDLRPGERLITAGSETRSIRSVTPQDRSAPVFNLEIEAEHVYYVSTAGVLVHNNGEHYATGSEWYEGLTQRYGVQNVEWTSGSGRTMSWPSTLPMPNDLQGFRVRSPARSSTFITELESVAGPRPPGAIGHHNHPLGLNGADNGLVNGSWQYNPPHQDAHDIINRTVNNLPFGTEIRIIP